MHESDRWQPDAVIAYAASDKHMQSALRPSSAMQRRCSIDANGWVRVGEAIVDFAPPIIKLPWRQ